MKIMLPETAKRVKKHTRKTVNEKISRETISNIARYVGKDRDTINSRLAELDREWDVERTLEANASSLVIISTLLGFFLSRWWLLVTFTVGAFLLQHALQGWCPPLPIFRGMGIRTTSEIDQEKNAMKYLRGDFETFTSDPEEISRRTNMD